MSSIKRKATGSLLHRRVRARREESEELEDIGHSASEKGHDTASEDESHSEEDEGSSNGSDSHSSPGSDEEDEEDEDLAADNISFGALFKAQRSLLNPKSKKSSAKTGQLEDDTWTNNEAAEREAGRAVRRDFNRTSKHAPTEVSSKVAVSRRREILTLPKLEARDPRFLPLSGPLDPEKTKKAYSFLDSYRDDEMAELKKAIKEAKDADSKEKLKQALKVMESRKKTNMRKDREQEVLARHKKEEKEKVKAGKKPFYLKKAELHKKVLVDEFKGMKCAKLDRAIERRRKKIASKEKKNLPWERRNLGE